MRHYNGVPMFAAIQGGGVESERKAAAEAVAQRRDVAGRGLHSSAFRLNLSAFYGIGVHLGAVQGVLGGVRGY